ncbi:MAG: hypothetical protein MUO52_00835 [Desulfobacterales bacterium]|nr:hypothetical protein [Desulfobacterales bacterium]
MIKKVIFQMMLVFFSVSFVFGADTPSQPVPLVLDEEYLVYAAVLQPNEPEIPDEIKDDRERTEGFLLRYRFHVQMPIFAGRGPFHILERVGSRRTLNAESGIFGDSKGKPDPGLIADFNAKNATPGRLENRFPKDMMVTVIPEKTMKEIFSGSDGWAEFRRRYVFSSGTLSFSRVGFNADKTKAVLFVHNQADYEMGIGYCLLLGKSPRSGKWVIEASLQASRS